MIGPSYYIKWNHEAEERETAVRHSKILLSFHSAELLKVMWLSQAAEGSQMALKVQQVPFSHMRIRTTMMLRHHNRYDKQPEDLASTNLTLGRIIEEQHKTAREQSPEHMELIQSTVLHRRGWKKKKLNQKCLSCSAETTRVNRNNISDRKRKKTKSYAR